jgi:hypothetical protein
MFGSVNGRVFINNARAVAQPRPLAEHRTQVVVLGDVSTILLSNNASPRGERTGSTASPDPR